MFDPHAREANSRTANRCTSPFTRTNEAIEHSEDGVLFPGERLDDLQRNGLKLIQHPKSYRFGMDSVLLAHFAELNASCKALDMGAGTGALCTLLSDSYPGARFTALEIQPELAGMLRRSIGYNGLRERIAVVEGDLKDAYTLFGRAFDAVVCNPPYKKRGSGLKSGSDVMHIARYEELCTLEDVVAASASVLRPRGRLFICQRAERFAELITLLTARGLAPKRIRFVHPKPHAPANLVLVCAVQGASPAFTSVMPPLVVYEEDGTETEELQKIYNNHSNGAQPHLND